MTKSQSTAGCRRRSVSGRAGRALVAVGVLAMAVGLGLAPASASGEITTAVLSSPLSGTSTTFTWSYTFNSNGGHDLSNIAIAFCSSDILPHVVSASPFGESFLSGDVPGGHTGFGPGVKFATTAVTGTLTVVFDQPLAAGGTINIQSHSGDGTDGDQVTTASGPGNCNATTTTADPTTTTTVAATTTTKATTTTVPATTTTVPATTTTVRATTTTVPATTTTVPATTTTVPATTTTVPATTTTVPATTTTVVSGTTTTVRGTTTTAAPSTTTTLGQAGANVVAPTTSSSVPTSVLGARFVNGDPPASLAKTGFSASPLVLAGAVALLLGLALVLGERLNVAGE